MVPDRLFDVLPRTAAGTDGRLPVGGCALADVAEAFGTPAFVVDEHGLRKDASRAQRLRRQGAGARADRGGPHDLSRAGHGELGGKGFGVGASAMGLSGAQA
jgi:hypothetical protein